MTYAARVARHVRSIVKARRFTVSEVADILEISRSGASLRLNGRMPFSLTELERLAPALGTTPEGLATPGPEFTS